MSVRTRIVATITIVAAIGMLAVGVAVYAAERTRILAQIDERLAASLESVRFIVSDGPAAGGDWPSATETLEAVVRRMSPDDNTGAVGIIGGRAALVPGVRLDVDLLSAPGFVAHLVETTGEEPRRGTYAEDGVVWRYLAAPIHLPDSPAPDTVLFSMAYDVPAELSEIDAAAQVFLIAGGIVLVGIAAAATVVATRLLRPLRQMRETAERVSANSLSERLPVEGRDDVSELAGTMNAMLDRIDGAVDSQRRLLSDVGHELKTPITIVRGHVEVMDPQDPVDVRETQTLAMDELDRMAALVQDLASAAALHGPAPVKLRPTDAADLLQGIIRKAEGIVGATVQTGPIADVVLPLDAGRITQAILQLAQNAVTHGGGVMSIGSRATDDGVDFWVRDQGPGVPEALRSAVFERFQRGDSEASGSGLGLNIVQLIARAHGGYASIEDPHDGVGAVFRLHIPRTPTATLRAAEGKDDRGFDPDR